MSEREKIHHPPEDSRRSLNNMTPNEVAAFWKAEGERAKRIRHKEEVGDSFRKAA